MAREKFLTESQKGPPLMLSDLEFAQQLQLKEALKASTLTSGMGKENNELRLRKGKTIEVSSRQSGCFSLSEIRMLEQERIDEKKAKQDAEVQTRVRLRDEEFARMISLMPEDKWEYARPSGHANDNVEGREAHLVNWVGVDDHYDSDQKLALMISEMREDLWENHPLEEFREPLVPPALGQRNGKAILEDVKLKHSRSKVSEVSEEEWEDHEFAQFEEPFVPPAKGHGISEVKVETNQICDTFFMLLAGLACPRWFGIRVGEDCPICFETIPAVEMFTVRSCSHRFCLNCVYQHVAAQVKANLVPILCPLNCSKNLELDECQQFLPSEVLDGFGTRRVGEDCPICFEDTPDFKMFCVSNCSHKFCINCLSQHVEVQVKENLVPVKCPLDCTEHLEFDQCEQFLPLEVMDLFARRLTEITIPLADRVYCPFPNCSAFMSRDEMNLSSGHPHKSSIGPCECLECHRVFCLECKVPWHRDISCEEYQKLPPGERDAEDIKLHELARSQKWQRCKKCQSMIELDRGCYHMTCRCGYEFCYTCGAEWKKKKPTCKCKLWDENNIMDGR